MDLSQVLAAVADLRDHLCHCPEDYVRQWSSQQCGQRGEYFDIPLIHLVSLLSNRTDCLTLTSKPTSVAIVDIVNNSPLSAILEFDLPANVIRFKSNVTQDQRKAIANYLDSRAVILAD